MDDETARLIRKSWEYLHPRVGEAMTEFYERLFDLAPEARGLFKDDMSCQIRAIGGKLDTFVNQLRNVPLLEAEARKLAIRHAGYGAKPEHYAIVGQALIETLRSQLGPFFDAKTEIAWVTVYRILSEMMIDVTREYEASPPSRQAGLRS